MIGSDSHEPEHLGAYIDEAVHLLRDLGGRISALTKNKNRSFIGYNPFFFLKKYCISEIIRI